MPGAVMDFQAFSSLLDERYREIIDREESDQRDFIPMLCNVRDSDRATERISSVGEAPQWGAFTGQVDYTKFYEQYNSVATHREFAQGMVITRRMYESDLSGIMKRGDRFRKIVRSGLITQQVHAASIFNTATSLNLQFYALSEAVPIVSTSHTTRTPGVATTTGFSNYIVGAFNPTNYRTARILMRRFKNDQGDLTDIVADELWTSIENEPRAMEILRTKSGLDSNFQNINPEADSAKLIIWNRLTNTSAAYLCNASLREESVVWWNWIKREYEMIRDFETKQLKWSGYGAWSVQCLPEWRWLVAILPS